MKVVNNFKSILVEEMHQVHLFEVKIFILRYLLEILSVLFYYWMRIFLKANML
jgi:hypothetical protein